MAEIYQDADNEMEAIEVLFQANSYAYTSQLIEQTDNAIRSAVKNYSAQLLGRKDYIAQLNLYERLTELEPDNEITVVFFYDPDLLLSDVVIIEFYCSQEAYVINNKLFFMIWNRWR